MNRVIYIKLQNYNIIMKGCYYLIIKNDSKKSIQIGKKLGKIQFEEGFYVYVG